MLTDDQRRKRIETFVKVTALLFVGFVFAPFVFIAIKGLIGLLIAGAISLVAVNLLPWFAAKVANWRLKTIKHEAAQNPIETLENQYQEREHALVQFRQQILGFNAEVQNFYSELEEHRRNYPNDCQKFEEQYLKMKALLTSRGEKYKQAQKKLKDFSDIIERKRSEWKIAQAAAKMSKAAGVGEDFISKLMTDTAIDSVQLSLNTAFAELEVSVLDEQTAELPNKPAAQIENSGPPTLDLDFESIPHIESAEKITVKRKTA